MAGPLRRFRRPSAGVLAGAWFLALALVVAGPLLGRGYLILLDFPSGPRAPNVSPFPLPSSGEVGNAIPLNTLHAALHAVWRPLPEKLFLLVPIVVGGFGLYRLVRSTLAVGGLAGVFGGTLYVINPFVYDRYLAGHLHFVLGYALLPWALVSLIRASRDPARAAAAIVGLWIAVLAAVSFHVAGLYAVFVVALALFGVGRARTRAAFAGLAAAIGALVSAYWLLPLFLAPERRVGVADLGPYESRPDGFEIIPTLLALYGFWREEFARPAQERPALYLLLIPILVLIVVGAVAVLRRQRDRRLGIAFVVIGALGVLLAAGTAFPPTAGVFRWLFANVPFMGAYREPQKFLALTVIAYAVFGAAGLHWLSHRGRRVLVTAPIALVAVLLYGYSMLWGLSGEVDLSRFPPSWAEADRRMKEAGDGALLMLPWKLYEDWTFTDARIVANPAPRFFTGREVLTGNDAGFETVPPASVDPFFYYVTDLLEQDDMQRFGAAVAPLGVRFIAWTEDAEVRDFTMLLGQRDLRLFYVSPTNDLAIFESRAWRGDVVGLPAIRPGPSPTEPVRGGLSFVDRFPGWPHVSAPSSPAVAVAKRCNDGWRLEGEAARCHLGAIAAFARPPEDAVLSRPFVGVQALGYAIMAAALLLVALLWRHARTTRAGLVPGPRATESQPTAAT